MTSEFYRYLRMTARVAWIVAIACQLATLSAVVFAALDNHPHLGYAVALGFGSFGIGALLVALGCWAMMFRDRHADREFWDR